MYVCPECSNEMQEIASNIVCLSCGLSLTIIEYKQMIIEKQEQQFNEQFAGLINTDKKNKRILDYLEWIEGIDIETY